MSAEAAPETSPMPRRVNYLNADYGVRSWLLTADHKRIAHPLPDLRSRSSSSSAASSPTLIRLELLTPGRRPRAGRTPTTSCSRCTASIMVFFFLIPSIPAVLGNFLIPLMIGARDLAFPRLNLLSWYIFIARRRCSRSAP